MTTITFCMEYRNYSCFAFKAYSPAFLCPLIHPITTKSITETHQSKNKHSAPFVPVKRDLDTKDPPSIASFLSLCVKVCKSQRNKETMLWCRYERRSAGGFDFGVVHECVNVL